MNLQEYLAKYFSSIVRISNQQHQITYMHPDYSFENVPYEEGVHVIDGIEYHNTIVNYQTVALVFTSVVGISPQLYENNMITMFDTLDVPMALLRGKIVIYRNPKLLQLINLKPDLIYEQPWIHLQPEYRQKIMRLIEDEDYISAEIYMDIMDEHPRWLLLTKAQLKIVDQIYTTIIFQDIHELKQKELELNRRQQYLSSIFESIFESIIVTDRNHFITLINNEAYKLLGVEESILGKPITDYLRIFNSNGMAIDYLQFSEHKSMNYEMENQEGHNYYINFHVRDFFHIDSFEGKIFSFFEIGEEKKREKEILYLTYHDILTGLHNRTFFEENLKRLDTSRKLPLSIILGDVNGLKLTNDVFGHEAGDALLKRIARVLRSTCRQEDIISRWGGDEFIILLPNTNEAQVHIIMNRIIAKIEQLQQDHDVSSIIPSLSLGYGVKNTELEDIYSVIKIAEQNMYKRKMLTNSSIYSSIISSLTTSLYERSSETEEHASRLYDVSLKIAEKFHLGESTLDDLRLFAKLHDIGKIGIPDEILNKPDTLTPEEWTVMKTHPEIGFRIANTTQELKGISHYILTHHERYDGNGYPKQLKGSEIPLLSRILSVVDAYDAMTHNRPYRQAISPMEAIQEITANSGTQFDPSIVNVFLEIIQKELS